MFRFLSLITILLSSAISLLAQTPDTATLRGQVMDQSHAAITGVEVKITNTLTGAERTARTDASGSFQYGRASCWKLQADGA